MRKIDNWFIKHPRTRSILPDTLICSLKYEMLKDSKWWRSEDFYETTRKAMKEQRRIRY